MRTGRARTVSLRRVVLGLLLGATPAAAQPVVTLQAGFAGAAYFGSAVSSAEWRPGPYASASVTLPLAEHGGLRVGLAYARRGGDFVTPSGGQASIPMDVVQLPLTALVGTPATAPFRVFGFVGVVPSRRVACEHAVAGSFAGASDCGEPVYVRLLLFEATGGVGIGWRLAGGHRLTLEASYHQGLSSIYDSGIGVKSRAVTGALGVELPLG